MRCRDFKRRGAARLEAGHRRREHLLACRRCRRLDETYRKTAARVSDLPEGPGPLPTWQLRVRARLSLARTGRGRWWARPSVWIVAYAVVVLLFVAAALDGRRAEARLDRRVDAERAELVQRVEDSLAPLELAQAQEQMAYQLIHVSHAWAHGRRDLARDRERALKKLEARLFIALRHAQRARLR